MVVATTEGVFPGNGGTGSVFPGKGGTGGVFPGNGGTGGVLPGNGGTGGVLPGRGGTGGVLSGKGGTGGVFGGTGEVVNVSVVGRDDVPVSSVDETGGVAVVMGCVEVIWVVTGVVVVAPFSKKIYIHFLVLYFASFHDGSKTTIRKRQHTPPRVIQLN